MRRGRRRNEEEKEEGEEEELEEFCFGCTDRDGCEFFFVVVDRFHSLSEQTTKFLSSLECTGAKCKN